MAMKWPSSKEKAKVKENGKVKENLNKGRSGWKDNGNNTRPKERRLPLKTPEDDLNEGYAEGLHTMLKFLNRKGLLKEGMAVKQIPVGYSVVAVNSRKK